MSKVTFSNVQNRIKSLSTLREGNYVLESAYAVKSLNINEIKRFIESAVKENYDVPFQMYSDLFESAIYYDNTSVIKSLGYYIANEAVTKTRNAKETQTLLKRRLGNMKRKLTGKISKDFSIDNNKTVKPKQAKNIVPKTPTEPKKESVEVAIECYEKMLEMNTINIHCDRIIENYNRISKRFNIDMTFNENTRANGVQDTVLEICRRIDTYDMPTFVKFNTVIETCWYGFESNDISYKKSDILEMAIDYFAFKKDGLEACRNILESTAIFDTDEDLLDKGILMEDEPQEDSNQEISVESSIYDFVGVVNEESTSDDNKDTGFNKLFKKFKKEELAKDENSGSLVTKLKNLVSKMYSRSVDGIIEGTPKLLVWIRSFFILGSAAIPVIGPILMVIGFIADRFLSLHFERKELDQMVKCFSKEIKESKTKLSTLTDSEEKDRMKKYIKSLEDAKQKISNKYDEMLTDDELSAKYDSMFEDDDDDNDSDVGISDLADDFDLDDDFDFDDDDLLEFVVFDNANSLLESFINNTKNYPISELDMYNIVPYVDPDDLINIAEVSAEYPNILYPNSVLSAINEQIKEINENTSYVDTLSRYIRLSKLNTAKEMIESTNPIEQPITIHDSVLYLDRLNTIYEAISIINTTIHRKVNNGLLEASFMNSLKVASMKLKDGIKKLTDKGKSVAKNIEVKLDRLKKSVEKATSENDRERILKGSILPSASSMIKLGIINAGLVIIGQPILAVIGTLGYLGIKAKNKSKERQLIIDEIEIELKMCEKYIDIAESKNDMVALKQLLRMQRDLKRQLQRVKYKMAVSSSGKKYRPEDVELGD